MSALLKAWAISPLVVAAILVAREAVQPGRLRPFEGPRLRVDLSPGSGPVPVSDLHTSRCQVTAKEATVCHGLAIVTAASGTSVHDHESFFIEVKLPGRIAPLLTTVRSDFFGQDRSGIGKLLMAEGGSRTLINATEEQGRLVLRLDVDRAYRAVSLLQTIEIAAP